MKIALNSYNNSTRSINYKTENRLSMNFNNYDVSKLIFRYNQFYIRKTSRIYKILYNKHISEIKNKKSSFVKHVVEHNSNIHFDI